jgi:hypothetical protein
MTYFAPMFCRSLQQRAVAVGDSVAQRRRMPSAKAFEFFLETSYVEVCVLSHALSQQCGTACAAQREAAEVACPGYTRRRIILV